MQQAAPMSDIETNGSEEPAKVTNESSGPHQDATQPEQSVSFEQQKAEKRRQRIYRIKLVIALFPCQFLGAVDATIVSTAMTTIASHFSASSIFLLL